MKYLWAGLAMAATLPGFSQTCLSGECYNGFGTYDYGDGWTHEGNFVDGIRQGQGTLSNDGWEYSGEFESGNLSYGTLKDTREGYEYTGYLKEYNEHGKGKASWPDGASYVGDWVEGEMSGSCVYEYADGGKYEGEVHKGLWHGKGKYAYKSGNTYEGDWIKGKREGQCIYTFRTGNIYTGAFSNSGRNGEGQMLYANGDVYIGNWENDTINGYGVRTYANGDTYEGNWKDYDRSGEGTYTWAGGWQYVGPFSYDVPNGNGKLTSGNKTVFEGAFDGVNMTTGKTWLLMDGRLSRKVDEANDLIDILYMSGDYYVGRHNSWLDFLNDEDEWTPNSDGIMIYANGKGAVGKWDDGVLSSTTEEITFEPNDAEFEFRCAEALRAWSVHTYAIEKYTAAIALNPEHLLAHARRAFSSYQVGDTTGAESDLTTALAFDSDHAEALQLRSELYFGKKEFQKARHDANKLAEVDPANMFAWWIAGRSAFELGNYADAISDFDKTLNIQTTDNGNVYYYRALAYEATGNTESACADFKIASDAGSEDATAKLEACPE